MNFPSLRQIETGRRKPFHKKPFPFLSDVRPSQSVPDTKGNDGFLIIRFYV